MNKKDQSLKETRISGSKKIGQRCLTASKIPFNLNKVKKFQKFTSSDVEVSSTRLKSLGFQSRFMWENYRNKGREGNL